MSIQHTIDRANLSLRPDVMMRAAGLRLRLGAIESKARRWKHPARPYDRTWIRRLHPDTTGHFVRAAVDEGDDPDLIRAIHTRVRKLARVGALSGAETMRVVLVGEILRLRARRQPAVAAE